MVTSSAVVGSSAISSLRIASQRNGDHRPLAHAAGKLVRIVVHALFGRRDSDVPQQLDARSARACARCRPRWRTSVSMICSPIV